MHPSYCFVEDVLRETGFHLFNPEHVVMQGMRMWPRSLDPCGASATPCPCWCTHLSGEGQGIVRTVLTLWAPERFRAPWGSVGCTLGSSAQGHGLGRPPL